MHKTGTHSPAALFWKFTKWLKRPFEDVSSTRMLRSIRSSKCEINGPTHPMLKAKACEVFVTSSWHNTFAGVFWKKNRTRVVSKLTTTNYISIERLWTADFEKNIHYVCRAFFKKLEDRKQKTIDWHSAELIRYQTPSLPQKYCTVSISKDQSLNVCQDFSGFWCLMNFQAKFH